MSKEKLNRTAQPQHGCKRSTQENKRRHRAGLISNLFKLPL